MKILMVDKFYFVKGGAERYMFELTKVLEANGHQVIPFAMQHPDSFDSEYQPYFAHNIEYNQNSITGKLGLFAKASGRMLYSFNARRQLEKLLEKTRPDIAHLHMIDHQLSPSILHALKKFSIPVLQTVHQYKLVCPNYRLYNPTTGEICEKCLGGNLLHPIKERCHKNSFAASAMVAIESSLHRWTQIYEKHIDLFHVPSKFMGKKFLEANIGSGKIRHLFYTINMQEFTPQFSAGEYLLNFGRLADEKGILTLLHAARLYPSAPLYIVGDGPQRSQLQNYVERHCLKHVRFLGLKSGDELAQVVKDSRAVLVPSEWYDNSPLVIYESFAYGKPVICSNMGGMPELVDHNENGYHFPAGNAEALVQNIADLWENPDRAVLFGKAAREKAEREFDPEVHYQKMYEWYQELVASAPVLA